MPTRYTVVASLALLLGGFLMLVGCGGGTPAADEVESVPLEERETTERYTPTLDGPLRLISVSPRGTRTTHRPRQAITVTFSRPMVALGTEEPPPESALTVEPEIEGTFRWEGTQTLVFTPEDDLPPATAFTVTVHRDALTSIEDEQIEEDYTWTFETVRPRLLSSVPADGERFAERDTDLRLTFNMAVDATDANPYIDSDRLPIGLAENDGDSTLVMPLSTELAPDQEYTLTLAEGLPTTEGPLGLAEEESISFRTYPPLALGDIEQSSWQYPDDEGRLEPGEPFTLTFSTPVRRGDLREALVLEPEVEWYAGAEARDGQVSTAHTLPLPLAAETNYTLRIEGLTDTFGQSLGTVERQIATAAHRPSLSVPTRLMLVESREARMLPVRYVNVSDVQVGAERIAPDDIVPAVNRYDQFRSDGEDLVPLQRSWDLQEARTERRMAPMHFDSLLTDTRGVVGWHLAYSDLNESTQRRFGLVQYTDLGLTAKFSPHQSLIFVTHLHSADPVEGATVEIRTAENEVVETQTTGPDGRAEISGWSELLPDREDDRVPELYAIVEHGDDLAFTSSQYGSGIQPYRFGISTNWRPQTVTRSASLFSDRGLYREGERVHVKGIARSRTDLDWQALTDSVRLVIHDPRDEVVYDNTLAPSASGGFDTSWRAPKGAAQGEYEMRVGLASDTTLTADRSWRREGFATGNFRVDAFRTAAFTVDATPAADEYIAGDFFEGRVSARYLFGAGMPGAPVELRLRQSTTSHRPLGYDDYQFGPTQGRVSNTLLSDDTTLDDESMAEARVATEGNSEGHPTSLEWVGRVTDRSQQQIAGRASAVLHPGQFYIGLQPSTSYLDLTETDELAVDLITVDPGGQPQGDHEVEVELVRTEWESVREVGSDGRMTWRSEETETVIDERTVTSTADAAQRMRFTIPQGGMYHIRAASEDLRGNPIKTDTRVYAAGSGYVAWQREDSDTIELVADQDTYAPGETARIMVPSPFEETTALITVERDGILESRVEHFTESAPQIELPIDETHLPNVFISVILLNERTAPPQDTSDPGAPGFRVGYVELPVDAGERRLNVDVTPESDTYGPGDPVTVDMQLTDHAGRGVPGEITFSAADAGVLNLIGYQLPDPFEAFYGSRSLSVTTTETRSAIVKQRSEEVAFKASLDVGGGGGEEEMRTDFSPLAHWDATVETDRRGRAQVTFDLPDQLTTMRLMAAAHTDDHTFGRGSEDITVTKPLVVQSALPRFIHDGDRFAARMLVTNRTDEDGTIEVSAQTDGLSLEDDTPQSVEVAAGATQAVSFPAHADTEADTAFVAFHAEMGDDRDAMEVSVPIERSTVTDVQATVAATTDTATEEIRPKPDRVPGSGRLDIRLASTALTGLDGALEHLLTYPYGCVEQQTSRIRPLLLASDLLDAFALDLPLEDPEGLVDEWKGDLQAFWTGTGFAMWPGSRHDQPYLTGYVTLALAELDEAGHDLPQPLTRNALDALDEAVRDSDAQPDYYSDAMWSDTRALMLYALARHGRVLESELSVLADNPPDSPDGLSYLLRALHESDASVLRTRRAAIAERLEERIRVEATQAYLTAPDDDQYGWIFASDARATAFGLSALLTHDASSDFQPLAQRMVQYLMDERTQGHWTSTQDNAAVLEAFRAYVDAYEADAPDFAARVEWAGQTLLEASFREWSLESPTATVPDADLPNEVTPLHIHKDEGPGRLYYSARLRAETMAPVEAREQGLRVERTMDVLDPDGEVVGSVPTNADGARQLQEGDLVRVTLRVEAPTDRNYVVVDDPLPAGLETVSGAFDTVDTGVLDAADTGQDRWWGSFNHTEMQDERVLLFGDMMRRGTHTYRYVARATTAGTFTHPAADAEMMYQPETRGRTATEALEVMEDETLR